MDRKIADIVELDEIGIPEDIIFAFDLILRSWIEGSTYGTSICESGRPSELSSRSSVLVKLSHFI